MTIPVVEGQSWKGTGPVGGFTMPLASNTNSRHFIIMGVTVYYQSAGISAPVGYTRLLQTVVAGKARTQVFYKFAEDGEPWPYLSWSDSYWPNANAACTTMSIANVDRDDPIHMFGVNEEDTPLSNIKVPSLVTTVADTLSCSFGSQHTAGRGVTLNPDSVGYTLRYIKQSDSGSQAVAASQATKPIPVAGPTGFSYWQNLDTTGTGVNVVLNGGPGGRRVFIS